MSISDNLPSTFGDAKEEVDLDKYPTAKALVQRCAEFFDEIQDLYVVSVPSYLTLTLTTIGPPVRNSKST